MSNLYEITTVNSDIIDRLIENGGELTPELEEELNAIELSLSDKVTGIAKIHSNFDGNITVVDSEIKRLQAKKKVLVNAQNRLKDYVKNVMEIADLKKIESPLHKITIAQNPASVEILDSTKVPDQYTTTTITRNINKDEIKAALKSGVEVEGCKLVTDKTNIRIK